MTLLFRPQISRLAMSEEGQGLGDGNVLEGNGINVQDISTELAI